MFPKRKAKREVPPVHHRQRRMLLRGARPLLRDEGSFSNRGRWGAERGGRCRALLLLHGPRDLSRDRCDLAGRQRADR